MEGGMELGNQALQWLAVRFPEAVVMLWLLIGVRQTHAGMTRSLATAGSLLLLLGLAGWPVINELIRRWSVQRPISVWTFFTDYMTLNYMGHMIGGFLLLLVLIRVAPKNASIHDTNKSA
jgi:hypothetical protein